MQGWRVLATQKLLEEDVTVFCDELEVELRYQTICKGIWRASKRNFILKYLWKLPSIQECCAPAYSAKEGLYLIELNLSTFSLSLLTLRSRLALQDKYAARLEDYCGG